MRKKADAQLVLDQLADRLDAAVAQMVDIVRRFLTPLLTWITRPMIDQDVALGQRPLLLRHLELQPAVQLVAPHLAQVIAPRVKEQSSPEIVARVI